MIKLIKAVLNIIGFIVPILAAVYTKKWFILFAPLFFIIGIFYGTMATLHKVYQGDYDDEDEDE